MTNDVYGPRSGSCGNLSEQSKKPLILVYFKNLSTRHKNLEAAFFDMVVCVKLLKLIYAMSYCTAQKAAEKKRIGNAAQKTI